QHAAYNKIHIMRNGDDDTTTEMIFLDEAGQQRLPEVRVNIIHDDNGGGDLSPPSLSFRWKTKKYRLWRVPEQVRAINKEEAYAPKFVSVGPYHRRHAGAGDRNRLRGEKLKKRYLHELLRDVEPDDHKHGGILQRCKSSLQEIVDDVRWFYAEEEYVREMKDEEMVTMLLHDGCFIIKHLYNFVLGYNEEELYATRWAPAQLRIDLGMLENQIPFFVLEEIFYHLTPQTFQRKITRRVADRDDDKTMMRQRKRHKLIVMAMWYMLKDWFQLPTRESDKLYKLIAQEEVHHLLHLLHLAHAQLVNVDDDKGAVLGLRRRDGSATNQQQQGHDKDDDDDDDAKAKANIVSAAQLRGLGVKISKAPTKRGGILDVRLRNGLLSPVLEVPALTVDQGTVQLLQNLVAYEQQGTPPPSNDDEHPRDYFTTYAFLMYNLVSSTDDIAVLQEQGVLLNNFGSHETIIEYFKNLCRGNQRSGTEEKTHIGKVLQGLRDCSQNKAYRYWAEAKKYMDSPVKILALIVSTLLAISTVLQTTVAFYPK
uniref:Uncharacterized protein n=2 Tax=Oryza glaberrima TaxID=4538 RepID=I1PS61_ORYGL